MSYAYRIKLERLSSIVEQKGSWKTSLMDLLSASEMLALLKEELIQQGWQEIEGKLITDINGIQCELSADGSEVQAHLHSEVSVGHTVIGDSDDSHQLKQARLQQGLIEQNDKLQKEEQKSNRQLTEQLLGIETEVKGVIDKATHQAHAKALEIKASRLGEIKSIQSSHGVDGELEISIHVKLR